MATQQTTQRFFQGTAALWFTRGDAKLLDKTLYPPIGVWRAGYPRHRLASYNGGRTKAFA